jgi:hypothetical protein
MRSHISAISFDQSDVDHAEGVLEQLDHLRHLGGTDRHHGAERLRIEQLAHFGAGGGGAAYYLGDVGRLVLGIAGIDAFGRKAQEEILPRAQAGFSNMGSSNSSVVPGYVVDSRMMSMPAWMCLAISSQAERCSSCPGLWFCAGAWARRC